MGHADSRRQQIAAKLKTSGSRCRTNNERSLRPLRRRPVVFRPNERENVGAPGCHLSCHSRARQSCRFASRCWHSYERLLERKKGTTTRRGKQRRSSHGPKKRRLAAARPAAYKQAKRSPFVNRVIAAIQRVSTLHSVYDAFRSSFADIPAGGHIA
jgi:hypothetical protein